MLTVMKSVHLYTFDELSETAKDAAAQWKYETSFRDDFGEYVDMRLEYLFPSSKPQPLYDFGCTQGSGFDIVDTVDLVDSGKPRPVLCIADPSIDRLAYYA